MLNTGIAVMLALLPWPCLGQEASCPDLPRPAPDPAGGGVSLASALFAAQP